MRNNYNICLRNRQEFKSEPSIRFKIQSKMKTFIRPNKRFENNCEIQNENENATIGKRWFVSDFSYALLALFDIFSWYSTCMRTQTTYYIINYIYVMYRQNPRVTTSNDKRNCTLKFTGLNWGWQITTMNLHQFKKLLKLKIYSKL